MRMLKIQVETTSANTIEDIDLIQSVQLLVKNLSVENLKLLAEKSKQPGINKKIQTYKKLI